MRLAKKHTIVCKYVNMKGLQNKPRKFRQAQSNRIKRCASEVGWNAGESPARRIRLFTTEHDLNSVAARRGWKLRKMNRWAITKVNHI